MGLGWRIYSEHVYLANQNMKAFGGHVAPGATRHEVSMDSMDKEEWENLCLNEESNGIQHVFKMSPTSAKMPLLHKLPPAASLQASPEDKNLYSRVNS